MTAQKQKKNVKNENLISMKLFISENYKEN